MTPDDGRAAQALLIDYGGVLTTDVLASFRAFGRRACGDPGLVERVLAEDPAAARLLVEHECGRLDDAGFEAGFAARLGEHGATVAAHGLLAALLATLESDEEMLALVARIRAAGVPVAVVSNQLGRDLYAGAQLERIADAVVLSSDVGVRKPSRRIYAIACDRLGRPPGACVMIDDLAHNLVGAARLGIRGIRHVDAITTAEALQPLLGVDLGP